MLTASRFARTTCLALLTTQASFAAGGVRNAAASGFVLYDQSAAALSQGSAVVGGVQDPAANWFNPAGLAFGSDAAACASLGFISLRSAFSPQVGARVASEPKPELVPSAFASLGITPTWKLGFGIFAPYGLAVKWPDDWLGRESAIAVRMAVTAANLNLAWRPSERLSVAAGASLLYADVSLSAGVPSQMVSRADVAGSDWAWQANAALMWKAIPGVLSLGASYRGINHQGRTRLDLTGSARFTLEDPSLAATFPNQTAHTTLSLPDILSLGSQWQIAPHWRWGSQVDITRWSVLKRLRVEFERPTTPTQIIERRSRDAISFRNGLEYTGWRAHIPLRAGVQLEQSSAKTGSLAPSAPDGHRVGMSVGAGYSTHRWTVDVGYLFLVLLPAESERGLEGPAGTYTSRAHMLSLTVTAARSPAPP